MSGDPNQALRILEAALFAAAEPLKREALARLLPAEADLDACLAELEAAYAGRGVVLRRVGEGWAFRTAEDLADALAVERVQTRKLSRAAVETLAVVAYHQPVTRGEIEEIRGVGLNRGTLDTLLEAGWVRPKGRRQSPGRPVIWETTQAFLDHFGLADLDALPGLAELKAAGLLDSRPAVLLARGELESPPEDDDGGDDGDDSTALETNFGAGAADPEDPDPDGTGGPG